MTWHPNWPPRLADPFPDVPPDSGPYKPLEGTIPFWSLYSNVTARLREVGKKSADADVNQFLEFLIAGFYAEYQDWKMSAQYFQPFRRARFRSLSLIAHAYFHMGYDLPRTIANSFETRPGLNILQFNRNRSRRLFLRLNSTFYGVFYEESSSYASNGIFGLAGKVVPLKSVGRIAAHWVIVMRSIAWINAERIADEPTQEGKDDIKLAILTEVEDAGRDLVRRKWNPILWLSVLPAPTAAAFLGWLQGPSSGLTPSNIAAISIVGILLTLLLYVVLAYLGLKRAADSLGHNLAERLERLLPPRYRDRLAVMRREQGEEEAGSISAI